MDADGACSELHEDKQIRGEGFDRAVYVAKPEYCRQQPQAPIRRSTKPVKVSVRRVVPHENQNPCAAIQRRHRQKIEYPEQKMEGKENDQSVAKQADMTVHSALKPVIFSAESNQNRRDDH